jgi:hypothetical protein
MNDKGETLENIYDSCEWSWGYGLSGYYWGQHSTHYQSMTLGFGTLIQAIWASTYENFTGPNTYSLARK